MALRTWRRVNRIGHVDALTQSVFTAASAEPVRVTFNHRRYCGVWRVRELPPQVGGHVGIRGHVLEWPFGPALDPCT
jgi:hypothetical protein